MATYSDNFDRANGDIGAGWVEDAGDIDIVSNKAESQTASQWNRARYNSALDSPNHYVQATIGGRATSNDGNINARQASSTQTFYSLEYLESDGRVWRLQRLVAGSETELDSYTHSAGGAQVAKITVNGASQIADVGAVTGAMDAADTVITAGTYAGISAYHNNGGRWDDWSAADLAAGGLKIPVAMRNYRNLRS